MIRNVFSPGDEKFSFFASMLENLKIGPRYDGFLYLAESARNPPTIRPHRHVELELNLVVRGTISYVLGGQRFTFGRGVLLWLFPAQEHQLVDRSGDAQNYVAVFKPDLIARACHSAANAGLKQDRAAVDGVLHTTLAPADFDLVGRTMDALMEGAPDAEVLNREVGFGVSSGFRFEHEDPDRLNAGLRYLLLLCWRCQRAGASLAPAAVLHPAVRQALELLSEGGEELDLEEVARRCGASAPHLSRMFARQIGVPLTRYRNSVRLRRFFEEYGRPGRPTMLEAVYAAGFGSYAQFHRVFTQAYGKGPRAGLRAIRPGTSGTSRAGKRLLANAGSAQRY